MSAVNNTYDLGVTITLPGDGSALVTVPWFGVLTASSTQMLDPVVVEYVARLGRGEDVITNYPNLETYLGE